MIVSNSNNISAGYGHMHNPNQAHSNISAGYGHMNNPNQVYNNQNTGNTGGDMPMNPCPPSCPPGQCCIPGHMIYGEVVGGVGRGGQIWIPAGCGPCGGGGGRSTR